jgi:hypothetical protein
MSVKSLSMPSNYIEIDSDEMEYIDGGGFVVLILSKEVVQRISRIVCIVAGTAIGAVTGAYIQQLLGGIVGGVIGFAAGFAIGNYVANHVITGGISWCGNIAGVSGRYFA